MAKTLKDRIASGSATLPAAIAFAFATWVVTARNHPLEWAGMGAMLLTTMALRMMSNENALMRMRTWLVPAVYVCLCAAFTFAHQFSLAQAGVIFYAVSLYFLFQSYGQYHAERWIFQAFFFLSIAGLCFPPLVWIALTYYFAMLIQLRVFSLRTFLAGFFGLIIPVELFSGVLFFIGRTDIIAGYLNRIVNFSPVEIRLWDLAPTVSIIFAFILFLLSAIHYAHTNFNDKIRTRMCFYILITQSSLLFVFLLLQPQFYETLSRFILLVISPVVGHYFAFSRGRIAQGIFYLSIVLLIGVTIFNLWSTSLLSF